MVQITSEMVKQLREITGIGMMDCKKALEEANGDMDLAIEILRKKGLAKAAKKLDRETSEGTMKSVSENGKTYFVSITCETDFLSRSDKFQEMAEKILQFLKENGQDSKESAQELINKEYSLEMGENIQIRDYLVVDGVSGVYIHSNGKLGALVTGTDSADSDKLKQVAMHVTASNPEYLSPNEIPEDYVEKEKSIQLEIMKNDPKMTGKPDEVLLKIIEGKMGKFKSEISLLEQDFVMDPNVKVENFAGKGNITSFKRFSI